MSQFASLGVSIRTALETLPRRGIHLSRLFPCGIRYVVAKNAGVDAPSSAIGSDLVLSFDNFRRVGIIGRTLDLEVEHFFKRQWMLVRRGVEQAMQMDNKIPNLSIIDCRLRFTAPGRERRGVVRKDADDIHILDIFEGPELGIRNPTAEHQVQ